MNDSINLSKEINQAARVIERGGVVAFPTDTFYGLGCDPFNLSAVERLFEIKERPGHKAILLLIAELAALSRCVTLETAEGGLANKKLIEQFTALSRHFWPGPLTIVLPARPELPDRLVSATRTIGVRFPNYPLAQQLTAAVGGVITATSANLSGQPNAQTAAAVRAQLGERLDYILDGGESPGGRASTVVDLTVSPPLLIREGPIGVAQLEAVLGTMATIE